MPFRLYVAPIENGYTFMFWHKRHCISLAERLTSQRNAFSKETLKQLSLQLPDSDLDALSENQASLGQLGMRARRSDIRARLASSAWHRQVALNTLVSMHFGGKDAYLFVCCQPPQHRQVALNTPVSTHFGGSDENVLVYPLLSEARHVTAPWRRYVELAVTFPEYTQSGDLCTPCPIVYSQTDKQFGDLSIP